MIRIVVFFTIIIFSSITKGQSDSSIAQRKISISVKNAPIKTFIEKIEQNENVIFSYSGNLFSNSKPISLNFINEPLENILKDVFSPSIAYKIVSNNIILYKSENKPHRVSVTQEYKPKNKNTSCCDTVIVHDIDTLIKAVIDTLYITRIDTIFKIKHSIDTIRIKEKHKPKFTLSSFYQTNSSNISYDHFDISEAAQLQKDVINSYETVKSFYKTGIIFSMNIKNISFSTGIAYRENKEIIDKNVLKEYIKKVEYGDTTGLSSTTTNSSSYISLPLFTSINKKIGKHFLFEAGIGTWANFLSSVNGEFINMSTPEFIIEDLDKKYLNKVILEFSSYLAIHFLINRIGIYFSPGYNQQLNSYYLSSCPITKRQNSFGYSFGLTFQLAKSK